MTWDPRQDGADCDRCPLREWREGGPVPAKWPRGPVALLAGEAPGKEEVEQGQPFVGRSGQELEASLRSVGSSKSRLALTNAICCRPPGNDLDQVLHSLQKVNKGRVKEGLEPIPSPIDCCRPRLLRELASLPRVIAAGKVALHAITGSNARITEVRGVPMTIAIRDEEDPDPAAAPVSIRLLPVLHPAHVMRYQRWRGALRADLSRALRWFATGKLAWADPEILARPSPEALENFLRLATTQPFSAFDVETKPAFVVDGQEHFDPNHDRLGCLGIGLPCGVACVIPFRSVTGASLYTEGEKPRIAALVTEYLSSAAYPKVGWNSRVYDTPVLEHHFGVRPAAQLDALGLHRLAEPELPHGLAHAGSVYTDVTNWKAGHLATEAKTDEEWWKYNALDVIVTARVVEPLAKACSERGQLHLLPFFAKLQDVCADLHRNGMQVNQEKRREWDRKLLAQARGLRSKLRELAGDPGLNPGSYPQMSDLLFEKLRIAPYSYTDLGDPSTGDDALRAFLSRKWDLGPKEKAIVSTLRDYRRAVKRRGVVVRLRPIDEPYYEAPEIVEIEEEKGDEDRPRRPKTSRHAPGLVLPDGRVHASWNPAGTLGWRFSSSSCNMQNHEQKLRDLFVARPGHVLVACDEAQLELRMVAAMAGARYYLERFDSGADPHRELCVDTFGRAFLDADAAGQKKLRVCVKGLTYGCAAEGTRIVTLGPEGSKRIEDLEPKHDWTWAWDGVKYAPTCVVAKWRRGRQPCVRVAFEWRGDEFGKVNHGAAVFTEDHRFLLRDGGDRAAGDLCPGDRLMPFARWRSGPYRMIDQWNNGGRTMEHRAIVLLATGDPRVAHHRDSCGTNNHPSNLTVKGASIHASEHWNEERREQQREIATRLWADHDATNARLTAGRMTSEAWRAANRDNYKKMREGLDRARAEGRGTTKGQRRSKLEAMIEEIGLLPDPEIARRAGVTREAVYYFRKTRGIPYPPKRNHTVVSVEPAGFHEVWDIEVDHPAHNFALAAGVFVHNSLYGALDETKLEIITSAEGDDETLLFPDFTLPEVNAFTENWHRRNPEIAEWWDRVVSDWTRDGYLEEPVMGLRCPFLDGMNEQTRNKLLNFQAQAGGAALCHLALFRALEERPWLRSALVQQGHDSIVFEVPEAEGKETAAFLERCMAEDGSRYGLPVKFLGEAAVGKSWREV